MALTVKPDYDSGTPYDWSASSSKLKRIFNVEGEELNVELGETLAAHAPGIPVLNDYLFVDGRKLILDTKTTSRVGPTFVQVVCEYSWEVGGIAEDNPDTLREHGINMPFEESLRIAGEEEQINYDLDGTPIGLDGKGASIYVPRGIWSFKVNTIPISNYVDCIGLYNLVDYPSAVYPNRPFFFLDTHLLYLGAEGGPLKEQKVEGAGMLWELKFEWMVNPAGFSQYIPNVMLKDLGKKAWYSTLYYIDPLTRLEKAVNVHSLSFKVPLYRKDGSGGIWAPWYSRVREGGDFNLLFPFNWNS